MGVRNQAHTAGTMREKTLTWTRSCYVAVSERLQGLVERWVGDQHVRTVESSTVIDVETMSIGGYSKDDLNTFF